MSETSTGKKARKKFVKPAGLDRIIGYFDKIKKNAGACSTVVERWTASLKESDTAVKAMLEEISKAATDAVACADDVFTQVDALRKAGFSPKVQVASKLLAGVVVVKAEAVVKYSQITAGENLMVLETGPARGTVFVQTQDKQRVLVAKTDLVSVL